MNAGDVFFDDWAGIEVPQAPATVVLSCNSQRVAEDEVEFLDVSEDTRGLDVMTFKCPRCGEVHRSYIYC